MKLLIDIGNTRIKWATLVDGKFAVTGELVHRGRDPDTVLDFLDQTDSKPDIVRAANVAGDAMRRAIDDAVRARWKMGVEFAKTQVTAGTVVNGYHDHRQMGVDRWLAILAAVDRYKRPVCVVDAGTAVTIDEVDGDGRHLGGLIVPGLDLMRRTLVSDTGDIDKWVDQGSKAAGSEALSFGRSTAEAIDAGGLTAICGLIQRCAERLINQYGDGVVVMTGGDAGRILPHIGREPEHRPMLVLEGLAVYVPA